MCVYAHIYKTVHILYTHTYTVCICVIVTIIIIKKEETMNLRVFGMEGVGEKRGNTHI